MTLTNVQPRRIRLHEYRQMAEAGIFGRDERVELIDGIIVPMSPQNTPHSTSIRLTNMVFTELYRDTHVISCQTPFDAGGDSQPEPDFALIPIQHLRETASRGQQPTQADLILEISDTSLSYDRNEKASVYACAGVPEYWILDLKNRRLEVRQQPGPAGDALVGFAYRLIRIVHENEMVAPLLNKQAELLVSALLPPVQ